MGTRPPILLLLLLAGASSIAACKAGSSLGGVTVLATPEFVAEDVTAGTRYVALRKGSVDGSRITLELTVTDVDEPVTAVNVKLTYPDSFSKFVKCTDGELFQGAGSCFFSEPAPGSGEVFVSRSIVAPDPAVTVTGTQVVARLEFIVFGVGAEPIVFEAPNLGGGDTSAVLDVDGDPIFMEWFSGDLVGIAP